MGLYYIPYILSHGMLLAKIVHFPPPVLFLGAEQCFWVVRTRHGAVERKHASWFYWFVFLNSDHGDEQRLDAKTRQRVIFLKSLNIRPLKTGFQHFSICGCLFFFFSCWRLPLEKPALPGWCLASGACFGADRGSQWAPTFPMWGERGAVHIPENYFLWKSYNN